MTIIQLEIIRCLSSQGEATADQVVRYLEAQDSQFKEKRAIAGIRETLAALDKSKQLKTFLRDGDLFYTI